MDQRIRAVEHIKAVNVAHRIEKTLQAFVASGAVFNPNDIGVRRQSTRGFWLDRIASAGRDVIEKHRNAQCVGNCAVMRNQLFLFQRYEVRGNDRHGIYAKFFNLLTQTNRFARRDLANVCHDRRTTSHFIHAGLRNAELLLFIQHKKFAVGAAAKNRVTRFQLTIHLHF
ncbi:hypothetical protein HmCmsJML115_01185 [Escherichia coli]|nr:hypothetical protein HmCmsJML099_03124 [Escherichia coli]GCY37100.1 hypothetical protein HmCmsJML115_01185 [Escherichia coli]